MDIDTLTIVISVSMSIGVFLMWLSFYPSNLNFLLNRIAEGNGYSADTVAGKGREFALLRLFLPYAQKLSKKNADKVKKSTLSKLDKELTLAGSPLEIKPIEFFNMQFVSAGFGAVIGLIFGLALGVGVMPVLIFAAIGFIIPARTIKGMRKRRALECDLELPETLDLISVCMDSGMTFTKALETICDKNKGLLIDELKMVLSDQERGASLVNSVKAMTARIDNKRLQKFYQSIKLSEELGTPIAKQLKILSDSVRQDTFEQVKQKAAKAATLIIIPVALLILPALMIVVAGPMVAQIMG